MIWICQVKCGGSESLVNTCLLIMHEKKFLTKRIKAKRYVQKKKSANHDKGEGFQPIVPYSPHCFSSVRSLFVQIKYQYMYKNKDTKRLLETPKRMIERRER